MNKDPICSFLGICAKGRKIVSGGFATEKAVKEGKALLVIIAQDASGNTDKKFSDMCAYREIPVFRYSDKNTLGNAIGCEERTVLAVLDEGMAKSLIKKLEVAEANGGNK